MNKDYEKESDQYDFNDVSDNLIILPMNIINRILQLNIKNKSDAISLYIFYYYTAKWQKTNQPKAVDKYSKKVLGMGKDRLSKAQKTLISLGLIERVVKKNEKGQILGWYIKINYILKKKTLNNILESKEDNQVPENALVDLPTSGKQNTNALSINNISALSINNISAYDNNKEQLEKDMKEISNTYPTTCHISNRKLQRSSYKTDKMIKLINKHGKQYIIEVIDLYIKDCISSNSYMKNFSTLINNFPSKEDFVETKKKNYNVPKKDIEDYGDTSSKPIWEETGLYG